MNPSQQTYFSIYFLFSVKKYILLQIDILIFIEDYNKGFMASNDGLWKCVNREKGKQ